MTTAACEIVPSTRLPCHHFTHLYRRSLYTLVPCSCIFLLLCALVHSVAMVELLVLTLVELERFEGGAQSKEGSELLNESIEIVIEYDDILLCG